jgi:hypothetical protein
MTEATPTTMRTRPKPGTLELAKSEPAHDPTPDTEESTSSGVPVLGGWSQAQREMDATSTYAQALKPDTNVQIIKVLDDQPYANYRRHWVERTGENGSYKRPYVCLQTVGKPCPLCDIGDRPQAVSAFNVALFGDQNQIDLKTWDVGGKLFTTLKGFHADPKVGPLTKGFFAVNKTQGGKGKTSNNAWPISVSTAREDYNIDPSPETLKAVPRYDASIIDIPSVKELQEIAAEMSDED